MVEIIDGIINGQGLPFTCGTFAEQSIFCLIIPCNPLFC